MIVSYDKEEINPMKSIYERPEISITNFSSESGVMLTASNVSPTTAVKLGIFGEKSFKELDF